MVSFSAQTMQAVVYSGWRSPTLQRGKCSRDPVDTGVNLKGKFCPIYPHISLEASMPAYEFQCMDCKKIFVLPLTVTEFEKRKYKCPHCGSKKLEEQFTSVNVVTSKKS